MIYISDFSYINDGKNCNTHLLGNEFGSKIGRKRQVNFRLNVDDNYLKMNGVTKFNYK